MMGVLVVVRRITMPKARRRSAHLSERFEDMALPDELLGVLGELGAAWTYARP